MYLDVEENNAETDALFAPILGMVRQPSWAIKSPSIPKALLANRRT